MCHRLPPSVDEFQSRGQIIAIEALQLQVSAPQDAALIWSIRHQLAMLLINDIRIFFAGVLTERANAEPQKYHVEYEKGVLNVKTPMSLSEELPRALAYEDDDIIVSAGSSMTPVSCVVRRVRAQKTRLLKLM